MLTSFSITLTICLFVGAVIVIVLGARARTDGNIARVLYDTEHPVNTRGTR